MQAVSRKIALDSSVDLEEYVDATQGFSGADLQAFIYNAQLEAVHDIVEEDRHDPSASRSNGDSEVFNGNFHHWRSGALHESREMAASERSVVSKQVSFQGFISNRSLSPSRSGGQPYKSQCGRRRRRRRQYQASLGEVSGRVLDCIL